MKREPDGYFRNAPSASMPWEFLASCALAMAIASCTKSEASHAPGTASADGLSAAATPPTAARASIKVKTGNVARRAMPKYLTLTGSIVADRSSEVAANVAGKVTATYVERGQPVKARQVIAVVDAKAAGLQAAAAAAQSRSAETQEALARQDCARADSLFKDGALAKSEYDRQKTACSQWIYNANAAQAQADLAGKLAKDTVIRAPIDGIVGERFVSVGEYVLPSSRVASIFAIDPVRIAISVPEVAVGAVREGQPLAVEVSAHRDRTFPAIVRFISPALRPATRDLIIEAFADNPERLLRPGMFATLKLEVGQEEQPTVPIEALRVEGTVRRLFLARQGTAYEMVVRTGVEKDGRIAVLEPLLDEDLVILRPPPGLRDGDRVE